MGDSLFVGGGVTSPKEARLASTGLLTLQGSGAFDVRTGVLAGSGTTQLVTGTSDTGPMTVAIAPHVPITSRGAANGPYIGPVPEAITKVPLPAAPGSNSRIDIVYELQQDATTDVSPNATTAPLWGVLQGDPSAVPVKKDLSTIPGALELATVHVAAGATSSGGAGVTITNTVRQSVARGARVPVRTEAERNALFAFPGLEVYRLDGGQVQLCTSATAAGAGTWVTTYDPANPVPPFGMVQGSGSQDVGSGGNYSGVVLGTVRRLQNMTSNGIGLVAPVAGWYLCSGMVEFSANANGRRLAAVGVNGAVRNESQNSTDPDTSTGVPLATAAVPVLLEAGDLVSLFGYQDSGAILAFNRSTSFLQANYLGPK
jgi:hypothetical protein